MKHRLLALSVMLLCAAPCHAQQFVRLIDNSKTPTTASPVDSTHGLPVNVVGGSGGTVAVSSVPQPTGLSAANGTMTNGTVTNSATPVSFTAASQNWSVLNTSTNGNTLYLAWTGSASTSSLALPPGVGYAYKGSVAISAISLYGSAASTTYSLAAQ